MKMGQTIGDEMLAEDISIILGPAVNIKRSPLCGRNFEYFSEDPYLSTKLSGSFIQGVQSKGVGSCIKHFAANNQEYHRLTVSSELDERTLREIYLASFEGAVTESKPWTIMASYNKINGTYSIENELLLTKILRNEWKWNLNDDCFQIGGFVMSDWGAVNNRVKAISAGLDLEMPGPCLENTTEIVNAVKTGILDESVLNESVERILNVVFKAQATKNKAKIDNSLNYGKGVSNITNLFEEHHQIAREIAENSIVLLENEDSILPLFQNKKKILFVGEFAKKPRYQGSGSSHINPPKITNCYDYSLSLIKSKSEDNYSLSYSEGFSSSGDEYNQSKADEAINLARCNDVVVIFAGLPEVFESEGFDRKSIHLPECQDKLIKEITKVNKNVVVVSHNGSVVDMPWVNDVKGIVELYLCGEAVGEASANVLFGLVNPSGHLSESFPIRLEDNPSFLDFSGYDNEVHYQEGLFVGYRYYDKKKMDVLFPFGHGLSYTIFKYSNIRTENNQIEFKDNDDNIIICVDIENTGNFAGKTVAQLYVSDKTEPALRPIKELKAFQKVHLEKGEKKTIKFHLNKRSFTWWNPKINNWYASSGDYLVCVGQSSRDENELQMMIKIISTTKWIRKVDMNTTIGELLNNPVTKPVILDLFSKVPGFSLTPNKDDPNSQARLEMALGGPLRMLLMVFPKKEIVTSIVDSANKLIEENENKNE